MKQKIILGGGTGLVGRLLTQALKDKYDIVYLSRKHHINTEGVRYIKWDGIHFDEYWGRELNNAFAVINLNGKSVDCRYNDVNKDQIYETRLQSTYAISQAIQKVKHPPKVWLNASTATIYRDSQQPNDESSANIGGDFSMDVAQKWEEEFFRTALPFTRKVALRMTIILSEQGGAYVPLQRLIRFGLGGKQASGNQMVSWIVDEDLVRAINFLLKNEQCEGVYNLGAPEPIPNKEFMKVLRQKNKVNYGLPTPKFLLDFGAKIIKTEPELILKSRYVIPQRLIEAGFQFKYQKLSSWNS